MGRRINEKNAKKHKVNICGEWIKYVRTGHYDKYHPKISQDTLIARLQTRGLMMKRSSLSRIETGCIALTDLEVVYSENHAASCIKHLSLWENRKKITSL